MGGPAQSLSGAVNQSQQPGRAVAWGSYFCFGLEAFFVWLCSCCRSRSGLLSSRKGFLSTNSLLHNKPTFSGTEQALPCPQQLPLPAPCPCGAD